MLVIGHRGASRDAPENTLAAFALARTQGADAIELDVQPTKDNEAIVFHDATLDHLCGCAGRVRDLSLAEVRALRVSGEPIPTLDDVITATDRPHGLIVEMKTRVWNDVRIAALTAKALRRTRALERGPVVVSSFNPLALITLRRIAPEIPRGLLGASNMMLASRRLWGRFFVAPTELHVDTRLATATLIARAHARGRRVIVWTVNDVDQARTLAARGVDGIITDVPSALVSLQA